MPEANALDGLLDIAASCLGLVGSLALMVTAWRLAPVQEILDEVSRLDPAGTGGKLVLSVTQKTLADARSIRRWERPFMLAGAGLLVLSFACSAARHLL